MKVLFVGDIVGSPGRQAFAAVSNRLRQTEGVDFVVANAENSAAGRGISAGPAQELFAAGADVITLGDHAWDQKEAAALMEKDPRIVRPSNFAPGCPGRGWTTVDGPEGVRVTVVSIMGRVFMKPCDCPFRTLDRVIDKDVERGSVILVDVHAEATSEKIVIGRYLDGRVAAVVGTHTHVQTSDEAVLPRGTAYLTDLGMTGPKDSALGRDLATVTQMMITGMPTQFIVAKDDVCLEGAIIEIDPKSGRARRIKRVRERLG